MRIFLVVSLVISFCASAYHGKVKFSKGKPYRLRDGKKVILKKGNDVRDGDQIILGRSRDLVIIKFGENYKSTMKVTENTTLSFPKQDQAKKKTSVFMQAGTIVVDYLDSKNHELNVNTKTAALAVRGTQFMAHAKKDGSLTASVNRGRVQLRSRANKGSVIINRGQTSVVAATGSVFNPSKNKISQKTNWNMVPETAVASMPKDFDRVVTKESRQIKQKQKIIKRSQGTLDKKPVKKEGARVNKKPNNQKKKRRNKQKREMKRRPILQPKPPLPPPTTRLPPPPPAGRVN